MVTLTATPVFLRYFAGTPTGTAAEGTYGWDQTNNLPYLYNGTAWVQLPTSQLSSARQLMEYAIEILRLHAGASSTQGTLTDVFDEIYSDSGGYRNTVSIGANTTATFSTDTYNNNLTTANNTGLADPTDGGITDGRGIRITMAATAGTLATVTKSASCTATRALLKSGDNVTTLATASFSGNVATFTTGTLTLAASTSYIILADASGGNYTVGQAGADDNAYPKTLSNFDIADGRTGDGASTQNRYMNISSVGVAIPSNTQIQTNAQTLSITPTSFQILTYTPSTSGTGTITYDISFNGGTNYQTAITAGSLTTITNTGTSMIVKQKLNAGASAGSSSAKGFAVQFG